MFMVLIACALIVGGISLGCYLYAHGKLRKYAVRGLIGALLLMNPVTGPICWTILGVACCIALCKLVGPGLRTYVAGSNGDRL